ncbi:MAG: type II toxin-antitoxin system RelE/ParE family toxin [Nanoarchaeales archaeon]|nr:type II toxin-antitoxin system RelE/ParE family toxin [Nanoarchaeales archaeon]
MSRKLKFLKKAQLQLNQIRNYIDINSNYEQSDKFIKELKTELFNLELFPFIGKNLEENYYLLVFKKNYLINYKVEDKFVKILRIINSKQER